MNRHARRGGHVLAAVAGIASILAIVAAWSLASIDKHAQGVAVAIAIPAGVVFFGVLVWLGRQKRPHVDDGWADMGRDECPYGCDHGKDGGTS